ncbi:MAG: hypothetical protein KDI13_01090 [Alphaproteobacteria bacterium]|nr:hypothetical protein [Alphaproteobacteria bacterium]
MHKKNARIGLALIAFIGGMAVNALFQISSAAASLFSHACGGLYAVTDNINTSGVESCVMQGYSVQNIYGKDGKLRIQNGIYSKSGGRGEENLSFFGLYDNRGQLRLLFRLDGLGGNESPLIIMKDTGGRDRVIMGLDLRGNEQNAFLRQSGNGKGSQDIVGQFAMPR